MPRHIQPREVAELKGADRKNPQRYTLEPAKSSLPLGAIPEHLTEEAKAVWFELETYAAAGVLTGADRIVLATLSELVAEHRADPRKMPANRIGQMVGLLGRLGMSPADRQKLGKPKEKGRDPFSDF